MASIEPPGPKAQRLLALIVQQVSSGRIREGQPETFLAYSEVLTLLEEESPWRFPGQRFSDLGLKELHAWTEDNPSVPKVTALIVDKQNRRPHPDFAKWHDHENDPEWESWWLEEANRAIRFEWSPYLPPASEGTARDETLSLRENGEEYGDRGAIVTDPPPARIRGSGVTVADLLQWLARGETESQILNHHPDLRREDIRASLAFAAERERKAASSSATSFSSRWMGKFALPKADPEDPRLTYLLDRYERGAR